MFLVGGLSPGLPPGEGKKQPLILAVRSTDRGAVGTGRSVPSAWYAVVLLLPLLDILRTVA